MNPNKYLLNKIIRTITPDYYKYLEIIELKNTGDFCKRSIAYYMGKSYYVASRDNLDDDYIIKMLAKKIYHERIKQRRQICH